MFVIIKTMLQNATEVMDLYSWEVWRILDVMGLIVDEKRYMKEYDWCKSMKGYCVMCI